MVMPAQAHFTLGNLTGTYRFHSQDFDPHVSGVVGYVWPGGGLDSYSGVPNAASSVLSPGYQSPYPCRLGGEPLGFSGGVVGSSGYPAQCNPTGAPTSSWYQLQGSAYAPFGAVLAGSTGDLIFAINATADTCPGGNDGGTDFPSLGCSGFNPLGWSGITIYLPPGFTLPTLDGSDVVTTVTNNYANIQVYHVSPYDRYAPGWTAVNIWTDGGQSAYPNGNNPYYNHQFINFTNAGEWYYFRLNQVTAPTIAGRYFFKILLSGDSNYIAGQEGTALNATASLQHVFGIPSSFGPGEAPTQFIPTQNWPVLLVKGEIDPAIMTGTVRYGGYNSTLYGGPVGEAGRVYAHMEDKIDPYTGQQITMCPAIGQPSVPGCTDAMGYFNATATGHYEVEGVAPGVYTLYAEAAGFPTQVCASGVTVLKGQSLHFDCYVQPGPVIHGNVFSKHQFGDEPWPCTSSVYIIFNAGQCGITSHRLIAGMLFGDYVKVELYDAPTLGNIPDPSANLVSWSPLPCVAGGQDLFFPKGHAGSCGNPQFGSPVAFPWHEYSTYNGVELGVNNGYPFVTTGCLLDPLGHNQVSQSGHHSGPSLGCRFPMSDPQGVGPPQQWFVKGSTTIPFHFEFGVKAEYGAPRDLDGMVPQVYATWVNGLTPGRYYVRAWVFRYVQTALDGATFQEYYFDVTPQEWAGDVTLPIDLRLSSWVNKTVHFHDQTGSLTEDPINTGAGFMSGYLMGADGNIYSYNQTALGISCFTLTPSPVPSLKCGFPGAPGGGPEYSYPGAGHWFYNSLYDAAIAVSVNAVPGYRAVEVNGFGFNSNEGVNLDRFRINGNAIQEGRACIQFFGIQGTWSGEDYGIPSGTYTPYTYVLGYLPQGPLEQVSVTLSGTMTAVSDHMIRAPGFNVTIYSIDWERPTVNRAWEFGNPEGWNLFENNGEYGSAISGSSRTGFVNSNSVGAEIDLGAYSNGSLVDWTGDSVATALPSSVASTNLFQNQFENNVTLDGGGFVVTGVNGAVFDANESWFGSELKFPGAVGGWLGASTTLGAQPFLACFTPLSCPFHNVNGLFIWPHVLEPTAFQPGEYNFGAFTYGYVQDQGFTVAADVAQIADVRLNLVIGVNITLDILFKKEHVITPTDFNMSGRVRIFNDQGQLVGEWMSSNGVYTPPNLCLGITGCAVNGVNPPVPNGLAVAADGTVKYPFGPLHAVIPGVPGPGLPSSQIGTASQQSPPVGSGLNEYNYIPGGITILHAQIAGLPQVPAAGYQAPLVLPSGMYSGDPVFTPSWCDFQLDCYASGYVPGGHFGPGPARVAGTGLSYPFPNTGISGYPDYQGSWTAEVDFVPWYANNTNCLTHATPGDIMPVFDISDPFALCNIFLSHANGNYYPPVVGLLLGESYHIIPGTTATSGISLTEDAALSSTFLGHSMVFNHLGPYSQEGVWQISGTHLSGEASGIFEVDLNGFISGTALAFTWANDFRPLSWATISVTGASGASWNYYTFDGQYGMYLPGGSYSLTISSPGIASQTLSVSVTGGEFGTAGNVYMQQSNIPVPEFTGLAIVAFGAFAASLYVLQRRRRK